MVFFSFATNLILYLFYLANYTIITMLFGFILTIGIDECNNLDVSKWVFIALGVCPQKRQNSLSMWDWSLYSDADSLNNLHSLLANKYISEWNRCIVRISDFYYFCAKVFFI